MFSYRHWIFSLSLSCTLSLSKHSTFFRILSCDIGLKWIWFSTISKSTVTKCNQDMMRLARETFKKTKEAAVLLQSSNSFCFMYSFTDVLCSLGDERPQRGFNRLVGSPSWKALTGLFHGFGSVSDKKKKKSQNKISATYRCCLARCRCVSSSAIPGDNMQDIPKAC